MLEVVHYYSTRCACMQHKSLVSSIDKLISRAFPHVGEQRHQLEASSYVVSFFIVSSFSFNRTHWQPNYQFLFFDILILFHVTKLFTRLGWQQRWVVYLFLSHHSVASLCTLQLSFNIIFTKGPRHRFLWGYVNVLSGLLLLSVAFFGGRFCNDWPSSLNLSMRKTGESR